LIHQRPPNTAPPKDAEKHWDAESFRAQIRQFLLERGLDASDWVRAWDAEGDDRLAKREFLRNMEHFVGNGQLWHTHMKAVAQVAAVLQLVAPQ
jgi:hypothetical protein